MPAENFCSNTECVFHNIKVDIRDIADFMEIEVEFEGGKFPAHRVLLQYKNGGQAWLCGSCKNAIDIVMDPEKQPANARIFTFQ